MVKTIIEYNGDQIEIEKRQHEGSDRMGLYAESENSDIYNSYITVDIPEIKLSEDQANYDVVNFGSLFLETLMKNNIVIPTGKWNSKNNSLYPVIRIIV